MAFHPDNSPRSFRATELAKEFSRQGHRVEILTKEKGTSYTGFEKQYSFKVLNGLVLIHYNSKIFRTRRSLARRVIDRFLYQFLFYPDIEIAHAISSYFKHLGESYDLLISIAKPYAVHIGCAYGISRNKHLVRNWIADCGDPFTLCKSDPYRFPFYFKWIEKWMFRKTTYITIPVEAARTAYFREFLSKIKVIPQGLNFSEIKLFEGPIYNNCPTFCYAGAIYQKTRNPQKILNYLATLDFDFKFIMYTDLIELLEPYMAKLGKKLQIRKPIPRTMLLYELSKMDFLINIDNVNKEQVPSKIIDYTLTKRPIISVDPEVPDYENIYRFLTEDYSGRYKVGNIDDFDISAIARKFIELVN